MMNRRQMLRNAKMITIGAAAVYLAIGINGITTEGSSKKFIEQEPVHIRTLVPVAEQEESKPARRFNEEERYLLAKIAMAEAEGEDVEGKALVINVVLNRVKNESFPDTIEEVIFQNRQFSCIGDGRWDKVEPNEECWEAVQMVQEKWDESEGALYFESKSSSSWHQDNLEFLFSHGRHYFYTEKEE